MSDKSEQPSDGYEPSDPWAPPERKVPLDKPSSAQPHTPQGSQAPPQQPARSVHDQPTITGMPTGGLGHASGAGIGSGTGPGPGAGEGAVPPPPTAPGGPARPTPGPYGYPGAQQSGAPYGAGTGAGAGAGYGYPGYPSAPYQGYGQTGWQQAPSNGMGITALVLGILAVVTFCFWGVGIILGVLALIFGFVGRGRAQRGEANNAGMALAGIILGAIGTLISAAFLGFLIWAVVKGEELTSETTEDPFATSLVVGVASSR
ncbi:DUF4190 domain-containing protein [Streptomyces sp. JV176]|uniref:DUF4190 domain-containing protein n=1 Tax=unclassified Streptomyces TaxID=2593676 RepID=UPI002E7A30F7|nr:DUF4190 domain-containing protein [Streptomyces sp. JV176]MEE1798755.1 DUF4190 domain-containing protein [Streptomyces sp. JV176]